MIQEKTLGPDHAFVALSLNNLATFYNHQGRHADAEPLYKRSLAIREKALGPEHPDVAQSLNSLAGLYVGQGRYADGGRHQGSVVSLGRSEARKMGLSEGG